MPDSEKAYICYKDEKYEVVVAAFEDNGCTLCVARSSSDLCAALNSFCGTYSYIAPFNAEK